jgi:hypothetical protein
MVSAYPRRAMPSSVRPFDLQERKLDKDYSGKAGRGDACALRI